MLPIDTVSHFSPVHCISAKSQQVALNFLLPSILLAGAATCGFALAGYLPTWSAYIGISVELVLASVILAAHYFKPKQVFENKWTEQLPIEIKKEFLKYLGLKDLGNAALVCPSWNSAVQATLPSKLQSIVEKKGWREDNVEGLKAYHALTCLGVKKDPKLTETKLESDVVFTTHLFSANCWVCVEACDEPFAELLSTAKIKVIKASSQNNNLITFRERTFEKISTGIGFFGNTIYIPVVFGDVILWDYVQDTCEVWKKPHDFMIRKITVTETRIMTYAGAYKCWNKDLTLIEERFTGLHASKNYAIINNTIVEFSSNTEKEHFTYKDYIIYQNRENASNFRDAMALMPDQEILKIVIYNTRTRKKETIFESKERIKMNLCEHILLVQQENHSTIKIYDLKKKKWLPPFNLEKGGKLEGAFAGMLVTSTEGSLKIWDYR